ncbi:MAG TPA: hypothetical protein VE616_15740 [Candidatus Udaeobacter sp.]|jgi:hypothetical protein|nr:hypothetical protein [Candidatus Udaeobacter sp.]
MRKKKEPSGSQVALQRCTAKPFLKSLFFASSAALIFGLDLCFAEPCLAGQRVELNRLAGNQNGFAAHGAPDGSRISLKEKFIPVSTGLSTGYQHPRN